MVDYTNPLASFKLLTISGETKIVKKPKLQPKAKRDAIKEKMNNTLAGIGDMLQGVVHGSTEVATVSTEEVVQSSDRLTDLVTLALEKQTEILKMQLNPSDENFGVVLRAQVSVCEKILTTQTKVDENVLRARNDSRLGDILDKFLAAEKKLTPTVIASLLPQGQ